MLKSIYVKNFVLIDEVSLDFTSGYSVFSGETGAGKSLLIDALSILCGSRFSSSYLQKGADKALIEAVFEINNQDTINLLNDSGYEIDDNIIIVSREICQDGKSTSRLNHRVTTLSLIKSILAKQIDIHEQRDTQYLLNNNYHLGLLDSYINNNDLINDVQNTYKEYKEEKDKLDKILNENYNNDELQFLQFQIKEIEDLNFTEVEIEELEEKQKIMANYEKDSTTILEVKKLLESTNIDNLYEANRLLSNIDNDLLNKINEEILNTYYNLEEQKSSIDDYIENLYFDEEEYNNIQSRLYEINKVIHKHGSSYKQFEIAYHNMIDKVNLILERDKFISDHESSLKALYDSFYEKAIRLHKIRKDASSSLEMAIIQELKDLSLDNANFKVNFSDTINKNGIDNVEFLISMNPGEELKPLNKVASGGELSRLMLGLKTIFNKLQGIETIIFDEIDSGVSGKVAYAIGKKMSAISNDAQVFSVTHLAPVAAFASNHYFVSKSVNINKTTTNIKLLNKDETIEELANISSGSASKASLDAANELYNRCKKDTSNN